LQWQQKEKKEKRKEKGGDYSLNPVFVWMKDLP
jgi:hypothetical protein